eukprot:108316-Heterocapsa_arctica.AAC.1
MLELKLWCLPLIQGVAASLTAARQGPIDRRLAGGAPRGARSEAGLGRLERTGLNSGAAELI